MVKKLKVITENGRLVACSGVIVKRAKKAVKVPHCPECDSHMGQHNRCLSQCHERGLV